MISKSDPSLWPVDSNTGEPILPMAQPGYYPGYDVLRQQDFWDDATRKVILHRINHVPPIRFFTKDEARTMEAVVDRMLPQDDRDEHHKIPILPFIDERLYAGRLDGFIYEGMPRDPEAYKLGVKGIQAIAWYMYGKAFPELGPRERDLVLRTLHDNNPPAGDEIWSQMHVHRFWLLVLHDVVGAYYAHPFAWNEIGYGGPAYPRGYFRLEGGKPEPWEVEEQRYAWEAPPMAASGEVVPLSEILGHELISPGQGGTH